MAGMVGERSATNHGRQTAACAGYFVRCRSVPTTAPTLSVRTAVFAGHMRRDRFTIAPDGCSILGVMRNCAALSSLYERHQSHNQQDRRAAKTARPFSVSTAMSVS
jgi:hypothetical protein